MKMIPLDNFPHTLMTETLRLLLTRHLVSISNINRHTILQNLFCTSHSFIEIYLTVISNSTHQKIKECIPVGCVPSAAVAISGGSVCSGGCLLWGVSVLGGVCSQMGGLLRGCLLWGVSALGGVCSWGVSALGGVCSGGSVCSGWCLLQGRSAWGWCLLLGGVSAGGCLLLEGGVSA